jgi:hypothetical protein
MIRQTRTLSDVLMGRRIYQVPCTVEIEHTNEFLKAHVELEGIEVEAGDAVRVIDPPTDVGFGDRIFCHRQATVTRGGWFDRLWARVAASGELNELYDISFTSGRRL